MKSLLNPMLLHKKNNLFLLRGTSARHHPGEHEEQQPRPIRQSKRAFWLQPLVYCDLSLVWFKGKPTGNHDFYHQIDRAFL